MPDESRPHISPEEIRRLVQSARLWLDDVYGDTSHTALDEIEAAFASLSEQLGAALDREAGTSGALDEMRSRFEDVSASASGYRADRDRLKEQFDAPQPLENIHFWDENDA